MRKTKEELCLLTSPFDGDFGEQSDKLLRSRIVKTRKLHKCNICSDLIQKNSRARTDTWVFDGVKITTFYWHINCLLDDEI